tara:strand:- start:40 stop:606 length:567 start_codon:yes stop_codon:yes gene_type:complete
MIKEVFLNHKKWLGITRSFGASKNTAKDVVSEMYLRLYQKINKGQDILYNGKPNYWYIYKMLKGIYTDYVRKYKKIEKLYLKIDINGDIIIVNRDGKYLTKTVTKLQAPKIFNYDLYYKRYLKILNQEKNKKSNLYFHQQHFKVFEEIDTNNLSVTEYSKIKNKGYYSVYNSYTKAKEILKNKLINTL